MARRACEGGATGGQIDYEEIAPSLRDRVRRLNEAGYMTTDSGDGTNHAAGMECALEFQHVFGVLPETAHDDVVWHAEEIQAICPDDRVEITVSPGEPTIFAVYPNASAQAPACYAAPSGGTPVAQTGKALRDRLDVAAGDICARGCRARNTQQG